MTTAQQCSSVMRLVVFVALAFGFAGFIGSGGATVAASSTLAPAAQCSLK